ncbi:YaaA family protein [Cellulomonas sp. S1-8]|uniref:YaaA family protein n=1 Tax=Cellulomonas sp. S1-8 TaxID=2904790 RepID=UPI00224394CC|nr:peroxide stress protein YaaA [Cellulomonas sp. S1-8]UZN01727.1 peroxide stress protein YaaA [Cellulomonas sp. S1-8]
MLVLLPPSEGKTPARRGAPPLDLTALSHPGLTPVREKVLDALVAVSGRPDACAVLGVSPGLADEVARNTTLRTAPATRASRVYSGVLYGAAGLDALTPAARARAVAWVRVTSALWGALTIDDVVPAYRLSMGTDLPGIGPLAAAWRGPLGVELGAAADDELVVDCRSATYRAAWTPPPGARWVDVRVLREVDGHRAVVSHHAKHTRGVLTRHLVTRRGRAPRDGDELAHVASALVGEALHAVELGPVPRRGPRTLSLVVL